MAELKDVEVFAIGEWNGMAFAAEDLDAMVRAFDDLGLSGRLPVKIGHDDALGDSAPAYGWITRLFRRGAKLIADLADVPQQLVEAVRAGRYRHVSIELLRDAVVEGKHFEWVPDAVAILGAAMPAVTALADLRKVLARRMPELSGAQAVAFTRDFVAPDEPMPPAERARRAAEGAGLAEAERLRRRVAELEAERATFARKEAEKAAIFHRDMLASDLERAVATRRIFPAAREALATALNLTSPAEALRFSRAQVATLIKSVDQSAYIEHLSSHTARETEGGVRVGFTNRDVGAERLLDAVAAAPAHLKFRAMAEAAVLDRDAGESFKRMWNASPFGARAAIA